MKRVYCDHCTSEDLDMVLGRFHKDGYHDHCDVMLVGEAPGYHELRLGKPFVGRSGDILTRLIKKAGLWDLATIYLTNIVKCSLGLDADGKPHTPAMAHQQKCQEFLREEFVRHEPRVVVCLGNTAAKRILGIRGISNTRGKFFKTSLFGAKFVGLVTYHPSPVNWNYHQYILEDLGIVRDFLSPMGGSSFYARNEMVGEIED